MRVKKIIAYTLSVLVLLFSIVLGYEDNSAVQNTYQPERAPLEDIVTFID